MTAAAGPERVVRTTPVSRALTALGVFSALLSGCRDAEPASAAELCAAIHQIDVSAAAALSSGPSGTATVRRTMSYSFGEDVQSAREIAERQVGGLAPASLATLLAAAEGAASALRTPGQDSYIAALRAVGSQAAGESTRLDCPA